MKALNRNAVDLFELLSWASVQLRYRLSARITELRNQHSEFQQTTPTRVKAATMDIDPQVYEKVSSLQIRDGLDLLKRIPDSAISK